MLLDNLIKSVNMLKAIVISLNCSFRSTLSVDTYILSSHCKSSIIASRLDCLSVLVWILVFIRFDKFQTSGDILFIIVVLLFLFKLHILNIHLFIRLQRIDISHIAVSILNPVSILLLHSFFIVLLPLQLQITSCKNRL